jgi:glucose/arabinose dehydrogenase/Leucine-rich repeat (LRR) protein
VFSVVAVLFVAIGLAIGSAGDSASAADGAADVRITARRLADGRTEFALQPRGAGGDWGERVLPQQRFFPAAPTVGRWLISSPVTIGSPGTDGANGAADVRITARRLADGRTEFALQPRGAGGDWGQRVLPQQRFFPAAPTVGRWLASSPVTVTAPLRESPSEAAVLAALYHSTNGPNWTDNTNWLSDAPVGQWHGVTVDDGRVTGLELVNNGLSGPIPPELGDLANLTDLRLQQNKLTGPIPPELGDLANLTDLRLARNQLSGPIPPELGDLANLTDLRLQLNRLTGPIPPELSDLTNLTDLRLQLNRLTGPIPPELGSLANLTTLWLNLNQLSGPIPPELGDLTNLISLGLYGNLLAGPIPPELGGLANLTALLLQENELTGPIPPELSDLTNLTTLWLYRNQLGGGIPPELGNLHRLEQLHLTTNELSGAIPPELAGLANLKHLRIGSNDLTGPIPQELGKLTKLERLEVGGNRLTGPIPPELGDLANLKQLRIGSNDLTGPIPPELGKLTKLEELELARNRLSGPIPPELGDLTNLERLWLNDNDLSGEVPPGLANLTVLWIHGNDLSGDVPGSPVPVRVAPAPAAPQPSAVPPAVALEEVFGGRQFEQPVEIGAYPVGPAGRSGPGLFVAEREGRVLLLHPDGDESVELLDISDRVSMAGNEEGLLSVALDPEFEETGRLWLYYSVQGEPRRTRLSRFAVDLDAPRQVRSDSETVVLEVEQPYAEHNGGSIRFGPDGMLYLGLGDGGLAGEARSLGTLLGSVIRIDVGESSDRSPYAVPRDNPFVDVPGARPEIWAYGFRNPWRMAFDPETGVLWAGDVGRADIEEIDRVEAGGDYGWNRFEGTRCVNPRAGCDTGDTVVPVVEYGHHLGCSVTGGVVYRGEAVGPLAGHYLFSDFCRGQIWALPPDGGGVVEVAASGRAVSSFGTDADGEVYVLTFWGPAHRIVPPP